MYSMKSKLFNFTLLTQVFKITLDLKKNNVYTGKSIFMFFYVIFYYLNIIIYYFFLLSFLLFKLKIK